MGGRIAGTEELYMADRSPLKKVRGSVFLRLKQDYAKTLCFIVSTEFGIQLDSNPDKHRDSTCFGYVVDGLAVCDAISFMDCGKDSISISDVGIIKK